MKAGTGVAAFVLAAALIGGVALAELKGQKWLDPKFETYNVKKIALVVSGTWKSSGAKVDPAKMADYITGVLERKGYEVVVPKKGKGEKEEPVDATLKVIYKSMSVGSVMAVEGDTNKGVELKDYSVSGTAVLTLATKGKKVVFKAQATTASQFKDLGVKDGEHYVDMGDPAHEFAQIVKPLPALPEAKEKEGKEGEKSEGKKGEGEKKDEGKEKKDEGGKKDDKGKKGEDEK